MEKKLVFLDIDGTLTLPGSNIPPESALRAIREAQQRGHRIFLCTGRNMAMLNPLLRYGFDGVVASAGGYVVCRNRVIYDCPMTAEQAELTLSVLKKNHVFRTLEALDATYGDEGLGDFMAENSAGNSEIMRWREALAGDLGILSIDKYDGRPIYKVVIMCLTESQLTEPRELLEKEFEFCIQEVAAHGCLNGELINRKFDKGTGVKKVAEAMGIDISDTIGFGDSMNDVAMVDVVGKSVCMANGSAALKERCDMICPSVSEDGLEQGFRELGLIS